MGRHTKQILINADEKNRDNGKLYLITEMSASQAEWWAARVFQALAKAGVEVPEHVANSGLAGVAAIGLRALANIPAYDAKELMDEMMACITIIRDKNHLDLAYKLMEEDIEEVSTRLVLRTEVFEVHTGFSLAGLRQKLMAKIPANLPTE